MSSAAEEQIARQREALPVADLTTNVQTGPAPLPVTFTLDVGSGRPIDEWTLSFGDGRKVDGTGEPPGTVDHLYARRGQFTARLAVVDERAEQAIAETAVTVTAPVSATEDDAAAAAVGRDRQVVLAAAGIVGAFDRFLANRRPGQAEQIDEIVRAEAPRLPAERRQEVVDAELAAERAYAAKARARMDRDVPTALRITDPVERERALDRILERERRYLAMRERAIAERATGRADAAMVRVLSPTGAFWRINPALDNCAWCRAMAGKAWNWDVLGRVTPPAHLNCACTLVPLDDAIRRGWLAPGVSPLGAESMPSLALLEARPDPCCDDEDDLLEAAYDRRWAKGTTKAGQFRPKRGGDPGRVLRRGRSLRMPRIHEPAAVRGREATPVRPLGRELGTTEVATADLRPGDQIVVDGELDRVVKVDPNMPGLITLERDGLVYIDRKTVQAVPQNRAERPPERPTLPAAADGDRYVLRLADGQQVEVFDRDRQAAHAVVADADVEQAVAMARDLNDQHRRDLEAAEPAPPQPAGGPTIDDVLKVARARRPKEGGEIAPGFVYDPELSRSSAGPDGSLRVPPGFFKQTRAVREKVVLRHLGGKLADQLGAKGLADLRDQDDSLSSKRAVVDAYFALNSDLRGQFTTLRPDAARLVATAAVERGLPLHPDAAKLARHPAAADAPEAEHPAQDLARSLAGREDSEAFSILGEAGYLPVGLAADGGVVYRNHDQRAAITTVLTPGRVEHVESTRVDVSDPLPSTVRDPLVGTGRWAGVREQLEGDGFKLGFDRGEWVEAVHPDGRGIALRVDYDDVGDAVAFTPTDWEIGEARDAAFQNNPLAVIKVGDDATEVRNALDTITSRWQMEKSAAAGETVDGALVELPDGAAAFTTYGRGERAITVQHDAEHRVTAVGLADPDPQRPGRIVSPAQHAEITARLAEEARVREEQAKAKAAKAAAGLEDAIRTGDVDALRAALGNRNASDAVRYLMGKGLELRARRRSRDKETRESLVTYTLRGPGGETIKLTGELRFGAGGVRKITIEGHPQGGRRDRLPQGQAPKTLDEVLVDSLGRGDELGARFGTQVKLSAVVQGGVMKGAAAHYEPSTGTIAVGKSTQAKRIREYLKKRQKGERILDTEHLTFYDDVETLQHEINHGVYKDPERRGRQAYGGLNKNVEEALTEETGHLLAADWLRSWGMTDVLAAVKRNPEDPRTKGVYQQYRVQLRAILDAGGVPEADRPDLLLRMKFQMTPEERNAELVRLAGAPDLRAALRGRPEDLDRRHEMHRNFEPVVRPDLSDIDAEPEFTTDAGRKLTVGMTVMADTIDRERVSAVVVAIRPGVGVRVRYEDGSMLWVGASGIE